jgi:uncharacterized protein
MPPKPVADPERRDPPRPIQAAWLEDILHGSGRVGSAAAAHGLLTGCLVADPGLSGAALVPVLGEADPPSLEDEQALHQAVEALRLQVLRALNDAGLGFEPLLPEDSEDLETRSQALGEWV